MVQFWSNFKVAPSNTIELRRNFSPHFKQHSQLLQLDFTVPPNSLVFDFPIPLNFNTIFEHGQLQLRAPSKTVVQKKKKNQRDFFQKSEKKRKNLPPDLLRRLTIKVWAARRFSLVGNQPRGVSLGDSPGGSVRGIHGTLGVARILAQGQLRGQLWDFTFPIRAHGQKSLQSC